MLIIKKLNAFIQGIVAFACLFVSSSLWAQDPLEGYVQEGLQRNHLLKQKNISLEKALYSLKAANSLFLPAVNFSGAYTTGDGGRTIALPVGDLLNPVYASLNQLTESNNFPQIENVEQSFFPRNFYDAHVRTSMPLLNTDLQQNKKIQQDKVLLQEWEVKAYERELVKNIKQAYYQYLTALEAVKIYESAQELVQQNLEVNQSLLKNGKGLPAAVLRAQSEVEQVKVNLYEAQNRVLNARQYFNFLLNKKQNSAIEAIEDITLALSKAQLLLAHETADITQREELQQLRTGEQISKRVLRMHEQNWVPQVNAFIDLGVQAENMEWRSRGRYYLLGVSLDVPIFNGLRNRYELKQAQLEVQNSRLSLEQTEQQLELSVAISRSNLATSFQHYSASQQRLQAAQGYFRLLEKGFKEGSNSLIEFIDARNQLTAAQLQQTISTYQVLSAMAQYERETLSNPIH